MGEARRRKLEGSYPAQTARPATQRRQEPLEALSWEVVGEPDAHPKTQELLGCLEQLKCEHADLAGGKEMVIILESRPAAPVVVIRSLGLGVFMSVISALQDLGLTDRLVDRGEPERGVDAAFS